MKTIIYEVKQKKKNFDHFPYLMWIFEINPINSKKEMKVFISTISFCLIQFGFIFIYGGIKM